MHIAVLLKQVHDPNLPRALLQVAANGKQLALPPNAALILNGYDANALEAAIRIREAAGGTITALALGADSVKDVLRRAIAMGADRAIHVAGPNGLAADAESVARLLSAAILKDGAPRLVLTGRSASDTDAGVVPARVANELQYAYINPVRGIQIAAGDSLLVTRITDAGVRILSVTRPAVLAVSNEINKPRSPALKGVAMAKRAVIPTLGAADLGVADLGATRARLSIRRLYAPALPDLTPELIQAKSGVAAGRALADRLRQEGLI